MWIVQIALRRPYTFVVLSLLIALFGIRAALFTPTDIFPYIDIPVVSVVWSFTGLSPAEMEKRIVTVSERAMTTSAGDEVDTSATSRPTGPAPSTTTRRLPSWPGWRPPGPPCPPGAPGRGRSKIGRPR